MLINRTEAVEFLESSNGRIFSVVFTKRTTGETRRLRGRLKVKKHLAGGAPAYCFADKGLIPVYDLTARGYRCISIEGITQIKIKGVWHDVE